MKKNLNLIGLVVSIVLILGLAYFFYNRLAGEYRPDSFVAGNSDTEQQGSSADRENVKENVTNEEISSEEESEELQMAPDFTFYDISGNSFNLSDYQGKPVVLNFWASWCGPCKTEMPGFENLYQKYGEQVQFLMINLTDGASETVDTANAYILSEGYTFPVFYDTDNDGAITYGITSIPTTYLISEEGELLGYAMGAITEEALEGAIEQFLP